jgi:hypothetical protein
MRKIVLCLALASLLALGGQAFAEICTVDAVPAATLLLPYFEVDLDSTAGVTTIFEINNATAAPVVAHVVVWSDLSLPVLDFNVYLTGYDIQPINMRDVLDLILPRTAGPATDPDQPDLGLTDTVSNNGPFSLPEVNFPLCDQQLPYPTTSISVPISNDVKNALTGNPVAGRDGLCFGVNHGDNIARGYVTVDNVDRCSLQFPGDPNYFVNGGAGVALNDNVLWGNFYFVDPTNNFAQGDTMVHIEADGLNPETATDGQYTFYGRYTDVPWDASDNREPLVSTFAARYLQNAAFTGGTDFICWRDSKHDQQQDLAPQQGFVCGGPNDPPFPFPMGQESIIIFDEKENPDIPEQIQISPQPEQGEVTPCPWETQRVTVGGPTLPVPFSSGWIYLNLNVGDTASGQPLEDPFSSQNWVGVIASAEGRFSVGFQAIALDSTCNANHLDPDENPALGLGGDDDIPF